MSTPGIIVSRTQRGNPVLEHIKDVRLIEEKGLKVDYVTSQTTGVLFLSMKYHNVRPDYIFQRIAKLKNAYKLRVLLVKKDETNVLNTVKELTSISLDNNLTMVVVSSDEEAAAYLGELWKRSGTRGTTIQGRVKDDYKEQLYNVLTKIPTINKSDVVQLSGNFGSLRNILRSADNLDELPRFGQTKARHFHNAVNEPFTMGQTSR